MKGKRVPTTRRCSSIWQDQRGQGGGKKKIGTIQSGVGIMTHARNTASRCGPRGKGAIVWCGRPKGRKRRERRVANRGRTSALGRGKGEGKGTHTILRPALALWSGGALESLARIRGQDARGPTH